MVSKGTVDMGAWCTPSQDALPKRVSCPHPQTCGLYASGPVVGASALGLKSCPLQGILELGDPVHTVLPLGRKGQPGLCGPHRGGGVGSPGAVGRRAGLDESDPCKTVKVAYGGGGSSLINTWPPRKIQKMRCSGDSSAVGGREEMHPDPAPQGLRGQEAAPGKTAGRETRGEVTSPWGARKSAESRAFVLSLEQEVLDKKWKKGIQAVITVCAEMGRGWGRRADGRAAPSACSQGEGAWQESVVRGSEKVDS